jgi:EAL domain-containing protein (putative c-di-GMP-specific phosphodiesterase class I)
MVRIIITLAHNLGMTVVAEGVETAEQAEQLRQMGCELAQGYFFSRPTDHESIQAYIKARHEATDSPSSSGTKNALLGHGASV